MVCACVWFVCMCMVCVCGMCVCMVCACVWNVRVYGLCVCIVCVFNGKYLILNIGVSMKGSIRQNNRAHIMYQIHHFNIISDSPLV